MHEIVNSAQHYNRVRLLFVSLLIGALAVVTSGCSDNANTPEQERANPIVAFVEAAEFEQEINGLKAELAQVKQELAALEERNERPVEPFDPEPIAEEPIVPRPEGKDQDSFLLNDPRTLKKLEFMAPSLRTGIETVGRKLAQSGFADLTLEEREGFREYEEFFNPYRIRDLYIKSIKESEFYEKYIELLDFDNEEDLEDACYLMALKSYGEIQRVIEILEVKNSGRRELNVGESQFVLRNPFIFGIR